MTTLYISRYSFRESNVTVFESKGYNDSNILPVDLPYLQTIELGSGAIQGIYDASCSLTMSSIILNNHYFRIDLPSLTAISSQGFSFHFPRFVHMSGNAMYCFSFRYS